MSYMQEDATTFCKVFTNAHTKNTQPACKLILCCALIYCATFISCDTGYSIIVRTNIWSM